jgi:NAD(P)H dehydrogenase (quinone)
MVVLSCATGAIYNGAGRAIVSGPEKAAIVSEVVAKPLNYAVITEEQLRAGLSQAGLPFVIDAVVEIKQTFVRGYFDILTSDIERLSGRAPKSFRDVVAATLTKDGTR